MKYRAFISYSHKDSNWGFWLHRSLETYKVPGDIAGYDNSRGENVPDRIFPVFLDREELPTNADLGTMITGALEESEYLLVICSPRSAASNWVNEEIIFFKAMGKEDRILALIVEGEPNATDTAHPDQECFPESLRFKLGSDNRPDHSSPTEPIAADIRNNGDGKSRSLLKIAAGILGVGFDDLQKREEVRRRRRQRSVAAVAAGLLIAFAGLTIWALLNAGKAERSEESAIENAARASKNEMEALRQKTIAEANADEAASQRNQAENNAEEAKAQRILAEENARRALEQEMIAVTERNSALLRHAESLLHQAEIHLENGEADYAVANAVTAIDVAAGAGDILPSADAVLRRALDKNIIVNKWNSGAPDTIVKMSAQGDYALLISQNRDFVKVVSIPDGKVVSEHRYEDRDDIVDAVWVENSDEYLVVSHILINDILVVEWFRPGQDTRLRVAPYQEHVYISATLTPTGEPPRSYLAFQAPREYDESSTVVFLDLITGISEGFILRDPYNRDFMTAEYYRESSQVLLTDFEGRVLIASRDDSYRVEVQSELEGTGEGWNLWSDVMMNDDRTCVLGVLEDSPDELHAWDTETGLIVETIPVDSAGSYWLQTNGIVVTNVEHIALSLAENYGFKVILDTKIPNRDNVSLWKSDRLDDVFLVYRSEDYSSLMIQSRTDSGESHTCDYNSYAIPGESGDFLLTVDTSGDIQVITPTTKRFEVLSDLRLSKPDTYLYSTDSIGSWPLQDSSHPNRFYPVDMENGSLTSSLTLESHIFDIGEHNDKSIERNMYWNPDAGWMMIFVPPPGYEEEEDPRIGESIEYFSTETGHLLGSLPAESYIESIFGPIAHVNERYMLYDGPEGWTILNDEEGHFESFPLVPAPPSIEEEWMTPAFLPGSREVAVLNNKDDKIDIYSATDGQRIRRLPFQNPFRFWYEEPRDIYPLASSGLWLIRSGSGHLMIYDSQTQTGSGCLYHDEFLRFGWPRLTSESREFYYSSSDYFLKVDSETLEIAREFDLSTLVFNVWTEPDGKHILVNSGDFVRLCIEDGSVDRRFHALTVDVNHQRALIPNADSSANVINYINGESLLTIPEPEWAFFLPDGESLLALINERLVRIKISQSREDLMERVRLFGPQHLLTESDAGS